MKIGDTVKIRHKFPARLTEIEEEGTIEEIGKRVVTVNIRGDRFIRTKREVDKLAEKYRGKNDKRNKLTSIQRN